MVLVCDWNVRAWTLLEALRGRNSTQILCRSKNDNRLIAVTPMLCTVASHEDISTAILVLTNNHLFPASSADFSMKLRTSRQELPKSQEKIFEGSYDGSMTAGRISSGFVFVSEAASLLGQRFPFIWSLLVGDLPQKNTQDIWARGQQGGARIDRYVHTGHL